MRKYLSGLFLILFYGISLYSAQNVVPVASVTEKQPLFSDLSKRDLSDSLVKYSIVANKLETQIKSLNTLPIASVPKLPDKISRMRIKDLRIKTEEFYLVARSLQEQVLTISPSDVMILQEMLTNKEKEMRDSAINCYKDKIKIYEDERREMNKFYNSIKESKLKELFKNSVSVFSASVFGKSFFISDSRLEQDITIGTRLELSLYPIINSADFVEIWGEYQKPRFNTVELSNSVEWNVNQYSAGLNLRVPFRWDMKYFNVGFRGGFGYYWGDSRIYNGNISKTDWRGYLVNFELDMMKYSWFYPLDVYFNYSIHYPTKSAVFMTPNEIIDLNKNTYTCFSVGLRICLWWQDQY